MQCWLDSVAAVMSLKTKRLSDNLTLKHSC